MGTEYNLSRLEGYLERQVGNSLYTYLACQAEHGLTALAMILKDKRPVLSKKQKDLIAEHKAKHGVHGFVSIEKGKVF